MTKYYGKITAATGEPLALSKPIECPSLDAARATLENELVNHNLALAFCLDQGIIRLDVAEVPWDDGSGRGSVNIRQTKTAQQTRQE